MPAYLKKEEISTFFYAKKTGLIRIRYTGTFWFLGRGASSTRENIKILINMVNIGKSAKKISCIYRKIIKYYGKMSNNSFATEKSVL
ncbi:hypothetical protein [Diplocloster agilis]|uniref:hypothetical protein n=1 Tax=Diplocloster agilis TaxID=2850323 RepID=UPI001EE90A18|nr:hypothetical protein [Diplocloster agilis]